MVQMFKRDLKVSQVSTLEDVRFREVPLYIC